MTFCSDHFAGVPVIENKQGLLIDCVAGTYVWDSSAMPHASDCTCKIEK